MVQARWGHLNRDYSLLTRVQAILLDGHFVIEHTARNRSGRFFNFNGTAGHLAPRDASRTPAAGSHDTLTEDLDLSYRAQLKGWRFVYLQDCVAPGGGPRRHQRLQEPAAPLDEGLDPDRPQDPARDPAQPPARQGEVRRRSFT